MKTKTFLTAAMCFCLVWSYAQYEPPVFSKSNTVKHINESDQAAGAGGNSSGGYMNYMNKPGEECNMYLNEEYTDGVLVLTDNTVIKDRAYRFNIYNQQMEFVHEKDTAAIGNPDQIRFLQFDGRNFIYTEYNDNQRISNAYMQVLVDGDYRLLLHRNIKYTYRDEATDGKSGSKEKYYLSKQYYLAYKDQAANSLEPKKKEVINSVQIPGKDIKAFLKENDNHLKTESDLVAVYRYCNAEDD